MVLHRAAEDNVMEVTTREMYHSLSVLDSSLTVSYLSFRLEYTHLHRMKYLLGENMCWALPCRRMCRFLGVCVLPPWVLLFQEWLNIENSSMV